MTKAEKAAQIEENANKLLAAAKPLVVAKLQKKVQVRIRVKNGIISYSVAVMSGGAVTVIESSYSPCLT